MSRAEDVTPGTGKREKKGFMFKHAEECHEGDQTVDFVVRRECLNQDPVHSDGGTQNREGHE